MEIEQLSRRDFIKAGAGTCAALTLSGCGRQGASGSKVIPVGLQLYSVRNECAKDLPGTIAKVAAMGYEGVEFAGYYDYSAQDLKKMLDDNGLVCCGTHTGLDTLLGDNLIKTIEFNKVLENNYLIVPWLNEELRNTREAWLETAALFNELDEKVKAHGMQVGYHNHSFEFQAIEGEMPWDLFFSNTSERVIMQIDTGNAMSGGGDPLLYLEKYPGRATTVHLKAYSATNEKAILGEGDIDWPRLFTLCETTAGTEWYIVEEEKDVYPPLECVEMCLKNLRQLMAA